MANGITLINLDTGKVWVFQFFPPQLDSEDQSNWMPQDVTAGTKPLMYANTEPQRIEIADVLLDSGDNKTSLTQEVEELRALMRETDKRVPPTLRLICGDWQPRVVLLRMTVAREMFSRDGRLLRARLNLSFMEHRQVERVTSRFFESEDEFNPIGNF